MRKMVLVALLAACLASAVIVANGARPKEAKLAAVHATPDPSAIVPTVAEPPARSPNPAAARSTDIPQAAPAKPEAAERETVKLDVPAQSQNPELYNGCEVTSLSMLLAAAGYPVSKLTIAERVAKDPAPLVTDKNGTIVRWGNPNVGFVGDITGAGGVGYGVYHEPLAQLLEELMPGRADDLTGGSFETLLAALRDGRPVVVWTNDHFGPESDWVEWDSKQGPVRATLREHAVLLVGYTADELYINDPLDGSAAKPVDRNAFLESWSELGSQALTYRKAST